eukprot:m.39924 g.39924  ORF g.39924 m.39924 type:complete len:111 (+) comp5969_c0_seq1:4516-4848(+)
MHARPAEALHQQHGGEPQNQSAGSVLASAGFYGATLCVLGLVKTSLLAGIAENPAACLLDSCLHPDITSRLLVAARQMAARAQARTAATQEGTDSDAPLRVSGARLRATR